jgi:glutathionyl-hydroquinone reductase
MASYIAEAGEFTRDTKYIETRITADGRDGYPVQPDRYRLVVAPRLPVGQPRDHRPPATWTGKRAVHWVLRANP